MKPGRELDALIAEKVMGFSRRTLEYGGGPFSIKAGAVNTLERVIKHGWRDPEESVFYADDSDDFPAFSTDMAAAWRVVEKFDSIEIKGKQGRWAASLTHYKSDSWAECFGDSAPHAICLAALKALGLNLVAD